MSINMPGHQLLMRKILKRFDWLITFSLKEKREEDAKYNLSTSPSHFLLIRELKHSRARVLELS